jgi:apolipoprotein N-acyltransferase
MDTGQSQLHLSLTAVAALLSATAFYFGTGLHPIWWLTWLAPLPLLLVSQQLSGRAAFIVSWLAALAGALNLWRYFHHDLEAPLFVTVLILVFTSAALALGVSLFRRSAIRGNLFATALVFPAFWVAYEYLRASTSPHSTALNIAYSQMNFLPILQIASIAGIWGIDFCVFLFPATLAALIAVPGQAGRKKLLAAGVGVFLLVVLGFGDWRLHRRAPSTVVNVALIASDLPQNTLPTTEEDTMRLLREYAAAAENVSARHPQAIVIPEKIGVVREAYLSSADSVLSSLATRAQAVVVAGLIRRDAKGAWNEARVYLPEGDAPLSYEKHHMLPPFESQFIVGTWRTLLHEPSGTWGVTICKDMDFPRLSRHYAEDGAGLLLVPAWDFDSDGWLHGRMAILRGVEDGFSIARAPRHGILSISDDRGRVLAELATDSAPFAVLIAAIPVGHQATFYSRFGDWFAWLNLIVLIVVLFSPSKSAAVQSAGM